MFGSAGGGQSRVPMRLILKSDLRNVRKKGEKLLMPRKAQKDKTLVGEGARYLGYGVMEAFGNKAGELTRACLDAPFEFTVRMRLRENGPSGDKHQRSLIDALICLGTHGGMGAKSRKGYGSLVIRSLHVNGEPQWNPPQTLSELYGFLADLRCNHDAAGLPEYTALSGQARHVLVPIDSKETQPMKLLDHLGRELMWYRSWGRGGKVLGSDSEKNFQDDHDLMKMKPHERNQHPRRIAFGLPHAQSVKPAKFDRRASPLFIHIHECGDTPVAVLSFLPARFLPKDRSKISIGGHPVFQKPEMELYCPIHDFLDRLLDARRREEPFGNVVEVAR